MNPKEFVSQFKPTLVTHQQAAANTNAETSTTKDSSDATFETPSKESTQGKVTSIPVTHINLFAQVVENSTKSRILLVEELRQKFSEVKNGPKIPKTAIEAMLTTNARREGKKVNSLWHVSDNVKQHV